MKTIANTTKLREINKERVRDYLKTIETATKNDIARETSLSVATCGNVLKELLGVGEVLEVAHQESTGGRPARCFKYNGNYGQIALVYPRKEGTYYTIFWRVTNLLGDLLSEDIIEVKEMTLSEIDSCIDALFDLYDNIKVLSLGLPGVVKDGCLFMCDFDRISHTDIASHIKTSHDVDVIVENDMNATAYGYYERHQHPEEDIAYIYFPVDNPPGAGIILNRQILRGNSNFAGELSFLPLTSNRDAQKRIQYNEDAFGNLISKMIQCINCVINPKTVILSGYRISDPLVGLIEESLKILPSAMHQPNIVFEEDIHESYVDGLLALSMNQLKCKVDLITRE
jgi:hypothetical protein